MNSFYKLTVADSMKRDRHLVKSCLGSARQKLDIEQREIVLLRQENESLRQVMRRYQRFLDEFESTWDPKYLDKTRTRKQAEQKERIAAAKSAERRREASEKKKERLTKRTTLGSFSAEIVEASADAVVSRSPDLAHNAEPLVRDEGTELMSPVSKRERVTIESMASKPRLPAPDSVARGMPKVLSNEKSSLSGIGTDRKFAGEKIDSEFVAKFLFQVKQACRQEKCLSLVLSLFDIVKTFLSASKCMIVPIDTFMQQVVTRKDLNSLELLQFTREFEYRDEASGLTRKMVGVAKTAGDMCPELILPSLTDFEN